jgi:hypothetical protein
MRKWNASMPRAKPETGAADVVLAFRKDTGLRMEFEGTLSADDAQTLMNTAIGMMKRYDPAQQCRASLEEPA